jgi:hypothetical protein
MRRIDKCINCGDERELVANSLCAKCYMAGRREAEKRDEPVWASSDRSQRRYIAERNKMLVNLTKIVKLVDETPCISPDDILAIKTVIRPYLLERAESLAPKLQVNTLTQNSELTPLTPTDSPEVPAPEVNELTQESELSVNSGEPTGMPKATKKKEKKKHVKRNAAKHPAEMRSLKHTRRREHAVKAARHPKAERKVGSVA